jgi:hypothetical protein
MGSHPFDLKKRERDGGDDGKRTQAGGRVEVEPNRRD